MRAEEEIRGMLKDHLSHKLTRDIIEGLVSSNPTTTYDYWLGYQEGVTFGYQASLGEEKK